MINEIIIIMYRQLYFDIYQQFNYDIINDHKELNNKQLFEIFTSNIILMLLMNLWITVFIKSLS